MFTGIVQAKGRIASLDPAAFGVRLVVDRRSWTPPGGYVPGAGDSICVSGVCLTVVAADPGSGTLNFDVITETLAKTKLGDLRAGDEVNLEPPVTANQPLGGHFMQGHVDGVGRITAVSTDGGEWRVSVQVPGAMRDWIVPKGSVALDGVSLTIASVADDGATFDVALIPTTLQLTTLGTAKAGDRLNIEADILAKTVVQYLRRYTGADEAAGVTMQTLRDAGMAP